MFSRIFKMGDVEKYFQLQRYVILLSLRQLAKTLAMGQGLAGLICGTAITSQYLASSFHVNTPMLQSFFNYTLLCVTYTTMLLCRTGKTTTQGLSTLIIALNLSSDIT